MHVFLAVKAQKQMLDSLIFENEEIKTKCNKNAIIIINTSLQYNSTLAIHFLYFKVIYSHIENNHIPLSKTVETWPLKAQVERIFFFIYGY